MKMVRWLQVSLFVTLLVSLPVFFTPAANAVTIHTLLIIDGAASNFEQHEASKKAMRKLLRDIKNQLGCYVEVSMLNTNNLTDPDDPSSPEDPSKLASSDNVLKWVSELRPDDDDVVWVYYSGHGGADHETRNFHIVLGRNELLHRNRLVDKMDELDARLKILMTDACHYGSWSFPTPIYRPHPNLFRNLLLEHKGFFNVMGAVTGEFAGGYYRGGFLGGGWFTRGFIHVMLNFNRLSIDLNGDGFISWEEVFVKTREETNKAFQAEKDDLDSYWKEELERIGQTGQNPVHLGELPKRIDR